MTISRGLTSAWKTAAECIKSAQKHQKTVYSHSAKTMDYQVGHRVMVHMSHESTGKLARPYIGPYCVLNLTSTNAEGSLISLTNHRYLCHSTESAHVTANYQIDLGVDIPPNVNVRKSDLVKQLLNHLLHQNLDHMQIP